MERVFIKVFTVVLALLTMPVLAQLDSNVLPLSAELASNEMARVLTSKGRPAECLAPLLVNKIDGETVSVSEKGFLITPGIHSINGKAILDMTNCPFIDKNPMIPAAADLEVNFEPGGTYYVGYYYAPANTAEWKLVVWHKETSSSTPLR
jgi:hypothetical protein